MSDPDKEAFAIQSEAIAGLQQRLEAAEARANKLETYAEHSPGCDYDHPADPRCTCGLAALSRPSGGGR